MVGLGCTAGAGAGPSTGAGGIGAAGVDVEAGTDAGAGAGAGTGKMLSEEVEGSSLIPFAGSCTGRGNGTVILAPPGAGGRGAVPRTTVGGALEEVLGPPPSGIESSPGSICPISSTAELGGPL